MSNETSAENNPTGNQEEGYVKKLYNLPDETRKNLKETTGTFMPLLAMDLLMRLQGATPKYLSSQDKKYTSALSIQVLDDLKPQNTIEGMLASELSALHFQGMDYLRRAEGADLRWHQDPDLNNAIRLFRMQHETVEKLTRLRRNNVPPHSIKRLDQTIFEAFNGGSIEQINEEAHGNNGKFDSTVSGQIEADRPAMPQLCDQREASLQISRGNEHGSTDGRREKAAEDGLMEARPPLKGSP